MKSLSVKSLISILIILGSGLFVGLLSAPGPWFESLAKPTWQPPNWLFGPVWTLLYILIGLSVARIWHAPGSILKAKALKIFALHFVLNLLWSILFFKAQMIGLALFEILVLLYLLITTIIYFFKIDKYAAYLLLPYCAWVSFASILNASIWMLNN